VLRFSGHHPQPLIRSRGSQIIQKRRDEFTEREAKAAERRQVHHEKMMQRLEEERKRQEEKEERRLRNLDQAER
jgi:hypothetical protein